MLKSSCQPAAPPPLPCHSWRTCNPGVFVLLQLVAGSRQLPLLLHMLLSCCEG